MNFKILRPPLVITYDLPNRNDLLGLKPGDVAKLTFKVGNEEPERMWVILQDCSDPSQWTGKVDDDATQPQTAESLPVGTMVKFHPFDIISVE